MTTDALGTVLVVEDGVEHRKMVTSILEGDGLGYEAVAPESLIDAYWAALDTGRSVSVVVLDRFLEGSYCGQSRPFDGFDLLSVFSTVVPSVQQNPRPKIFVLTSDGESRPLCDILQAEGVIDGHADKSDPKIWHDKLRECLREPSSLTAETTAPINNSGQSLEVVVDCSNLSSALKEMIPIGGIACQRDHLIEEVERACERPFRHHERVSVESSKARSNSGLVLVVYPEDASRKNRFEETIFILKVVSATDMEREALNYSRQGKPIRGYAPLLYALGVFQKQPDIGFLLYEWIGSKRTVTLSEKVEKWLEDAGAAAQQGGPGEEDLKAALEHYRREMCCVPTRVFSTALHGWYSICKPATAKNTYKWFAERKKVIQKARSKIQTHFPDVNSNDDEIQVDFSLSDPLVFRCANPVKVFEALDTSLKAKDFYVSATVHGDLHSRNIVCDPDRPLDTDDSTTKMFNWQLIDFGSVQEDISVTADLAALESDLKFFRSNLPCATSTFRMERNLTETLLPAGERLSSFLLFDRLTVALEPRAYVLSAVIEKSRENTYAYWQGMSRRHDARQRVACFQEQMCVSLLGMALYSLQFANHPLRFVHIFLSACMMAEAVKTWESHNIAHAQDFG
jgi:CheY-like chemotaxis protein